MPFSFIIEQRRNFRSSLANFQEYSDISIKYNTETDYVQLYNGERWIDWMLAGLQAIDFLAFTPDNWIVVDQSASHTFSISDGLLSLTAIPGSSGGGNVIATCSHPVNLSGKNRIVIRGRIYLYTTSRAIIKIGSYTYNTPQANGKWVDIYEIGDLSNADGEQLLSITLPCYAGYANSQIQLTMLLIN